jgi:hypothetical protein
VKILLPALAFGYAAFCAWLAVRIVNRRERWAKWTLAASFGVPLLYAAGFGPACWLAAKNYDCERAVSMIYEPLISPLEKREHTRLSLFVRWWCGLAEESGEPYWYCYGLKMGKVPVYSDADRPWW